MMCVSASAGAAMTACGRCSCTIAPISSYSAMNQLVTHAATFHFQDNRARPTVPMMGLCGSAIGRWMGLGRALAGDPGTCCWRTGLKIVMTPARRLRPGAAARGDRRQQSGCWYSSTVAYEEGPRFRASSTPSRWAKAFIAAAAATSRSAALSQRWSLCAAGATQPCGRRASKPTSIDLRTREAPSERSSPSRWRRRAAAGGGHAVWSMGGCARKSVCLAARSGFIT